MLQGLINFSLVISLASPLVFCGVSYILLGVLGEMFCFFCDCGVMLGQSEGCIHLLHFHMPYLYAGASLRVRVRVRSGSRKRDLYSSTLHTQCSLDETVPCEGVGTYNTCPAVR